MPLKLQLFTLLQFLAWQIAYVQPVAFSNQTQILNPTSGFTNYADCAVDMNGDWLDDVVRIGNKGIYIDFQQPDGTFFQRFFPLLIQTPPEWSICAGDLDNDGFNDLLFAGSEAVSIVKAKNGGDFFQETVMPAMIFSQRSTMADIDNDGWLDAFVCHDEGQSLPFRNDGAGNLSLDFDLIQTLNIPGNYAAIWTDYDNDGDIDLYISKCFAGTPPGHPARINLLYRNNGDSTFTEVGAQAGVNDDAQSWSTVFEDFDNDGDFDAFIVNHDFLNRLFRNNGDGTFTDVIANSGIAPNDLGAWENASGDFNNDGFVDIFSELQNELNLGKGDLTFSGQNSPVKPGAIADLNNDGFLDVLINSQLWLNEPNGNHWLKILPFGIASNRNGVGARIEIYGAWGMQVREVRSGQSFSPMSSLTAHFGLGQNEQVDSVKIRWTSGTVTTLTNLPADTLLVVPEASCLLPMASLTVLGELKICPGDSTELQAPAGFASYAWSNGQVGQSLQVKKAGRYFTILTDSAGCVALSQPVEIQGIEEVLPEIFSPAGNVVCQGDTLLLTASAGENYTWSNGETGTPGIAALQSGNYTVAVDAQCFQGQISSQPFHVNVLPAPPPLVEVAEIDQNDSILLVAQGENCRWFDQPIGGNLLAEGCDLQTPPLATTTTFFVESRHVFPGEIQSGGKPDTTGAGGLQQQSGFLEFETWSTFTLLSVTVFAPQIPAPGLRHVQLWSGDSMLAVKSFQLSTGFNELDLNFEVPPGKYSLRCPQGNLWRNEGTLDFPYPIGNVGQITTSSFGKGYYYYFYDWKIKKPDFECVSERAPALVLVTGTKDIAENRPLSVFPNPANGRVFVETYHPATYFRLLEASGRVAMVGHLNGELDFEIDLSQLPHGVFCLQIFGQDFFAMSGIVRK